MAGMGWTPRLNVERAVNQIVEWYLENPVWLGLEAKKVAA
jgi:dTDP-D-glucose 4,6-dehydratase